MNELKSDPANFTYDYESVTVIANPVTGMLDIDGLRVGQADYRFSTVHDYWVYDCLVYRIAPYSKKGRFVYAGTQTTFEKAVARVLDAYFNE